ncbi:unnamed protein product, partial [Discosporangium mesarthrocarpum]
MPSLVFLGKRWLLSGDELAFPMAVSASARTALVCTFIIALCFTTSYSLLDFRCGARIGYVMVSIAVLIASTVVEVAMGKASGYGTITEPGIRTQSLLRHARRKVWLGGAQALLS